MKEAEFVWKSQPLFCTRGRNSASEAVLHSILRGNSRVEAARPDLDGLEVASQMLTAELPSPSATTAARCTTHHVRQRAPPASAAVKTASCGLAASEDASLGSPTLSRRSNSPPKTVVSGWISLISVDFLRSTLTKSGEFFGTLDEYQRRREGEAAWLLLAAGCYRTGLP